MLIALQVLERVSVNASMASQKKTPQTECKGYNVFLLLGNEWFPGKNYNFAV